MPGQEKVVKVADKTRRDMVMAKTRRPSLAALNVGALTHTAGGRRWRAVFVPPGARVGRLGVTAAGKLGPAARAVYTALAGPGTEADVAQRTGLSLKTVGPRIGQDLIKAGLVEVVGHVENDRKRKVRVYGQVPPERVAEARAEAKDRLRVKPPRKRPLEMRKRMARELFKDPDLLEALTADKAADRASARARKTAREELRDRERRAAELRRTRSRPRWRRTPGCRSGVHCASSRMGQTLHESWGWCSTGISNSRAWVAEPHIDAVQWADGVRHTTDMLEVAGGLHEALHAAFHLDRADCPACGSPPAESEDADVVEGEVLEELHQLASEDR